MTNEKIHLIQYFTARYGNGRPNYPVMPEGEIQDLTIFVGPSSWSLLTIIGCNGEFLNKVNLMLREDVYMFFYKHGLYKHG